MLLPFSFSVRPLLENTCDDDGGGLSVIASAKGANVLIDSCHFINNYGSFTGGAISYQIYGSGNFINTQNSIFSNNNATGAGGGILMYNNRVSSNNQYELSNCDFKNNSTTEFGSGQAEGGGAIYVATSGKNNFVNIQNSEFTENSSKGFGGAVGIRNKKPGANLHAQVSNCQFERNTSDNGGGLYYQGECIKDSFLVQQCKFIENSISEQHPSQFTRGGALYIEYNSDSKDSRAFIEDCTFENNLTKDGDGGALAISPFGLGSFSQISNSTFKSNKSVGTGGAIFNLGLATTYDIQACTFDNNQAIKGGSIIYELQNLGKRQFYIYFHGIYGFKFCIVCYYS